MVFGEAGDATAQAPSVLAYIACMYVVCREVLADFEQDGSGSELEKEDQKANCRYTSTFCTIQMWFVAA